MLRLDEMSEYFDFEEEEVFDEDDVDTVGGFVVKLLGRIAEVGDKVEFKDFTFTVKEIDGARITKLEIIRKETQPSNTDAE